MLKLRHRRTADTKRRGAPGRESPDSRFITQTSPRLACPLGLSIDSAVSAVAATRRFWRRWQDPRHKRVISRRFWRYAPARRQAATAPLEDPPAEPVLVPMNIEIRRGSAGVGCFRFLDARDSCYARSGDAQLPPLRGMRFPRSSAKPQTAPAGTGRRLQGMASMGASPKSGSGNDGCAWLPAKTVERRENPCKDAVRPRRR
jgi:hypothetical protein